MFRLVVFYIWIIVIQVLFKACLLTHNYATMAMPTARALRYTPRSYLAVGCRCDPYREYNLKEHSVREDISYL